MAELTTAFPFIDGLGQRYLADIYLTRMYQIYQDFLATRMGLASAGAVIMAVALLGFSVTNMRIMGRSQAEE